ncbi:hypothetical protein [Gordonia polyisoprenivorans]|uniref:hypothetical protein n=1 Tax=Gordonia polyisoprenivorans TaxID=84595 RepID=UPI001AD63089|nr:hypothetical protein [Gordonia polyisoprenivorans]QTI70673.1 hypothetical protein J6U32_09115 [Gordonia polyisoprenivorans]
MWVTSQTLEWATQTTKECSRMAASKTRRNVRVLGATAAIAGVGALTAAMAAPASADVTGVSITTPSGFALSSGSFGTSCSYTVSADINNSQAGAPSVVFKAAKAGGSTSTIGTVTFNQAGPTTVTATWKPTSKGVYTITATQNGVSQSTTANVTGTGIQLPAPLGNGNCLVLPF